MALKDEYEFQFDDLPKRSFSFFENTRTEFCDITFKVGDRSISAHRIILSAAMPFFYKVFSDKETTDAVETEIAFPDIDPDAFESLIEYAYKCKVKICMENVRMLLSGACILQVDEVKNACCQFLIDRLNADNVWAIRCYSSGLDSPELTEKIDNFFINNFSEIMMTEKFLDISFTLLSKLICSDELNVRNEEVIFESALKWVKHCPEERKENLLDILRNIRFTLLDVRYIRNYMSKEVFIRSSPSCRDLVDEAIFYHLIPEERKEICSFPTSPRRFLTSDQKSDVTSQRSYLTSDQKSDVTSQRRFLTSDQKSDVTSPRSFLTSDQKSDVTSPRSFLTSDQKSDVTSPRSFLTSDQKSDVKENFNICILFHGEKNVVHSFDVANEKWKVRRIKGNPIFLSHFDAVVALDKKMYCFHQGSTEILDLERNSYSSCEGMIYPRTHTGSVAHENKVFVCGGYEGGKALNVVECFNSQTERFIQLRCMNTCRISPGTAAYEEFIYVLGGSNGILSSYNSVEKYNVKMGMWSRSSPMLTARCSFGCCTLKDKMYVCGGFNKTQYLRTSEVFDFATKEWKFIASMNNPMRNCKLVSCCNKLYVFVDCRYTEPRDISVEIYEEETDKWTVGPSLDKRKHVVGAAVILLPFV